MIDHPVLYPTIQPSPSAPDKSYAVKLMLARLWKVTALEQATHHPDANRITRALGMAADVDAELRPQPVHHVTGDAFILCSDGLSDLVEDGEILGGDVVEEEPVEVVDDEIEDEGYVLEDEEEELEKEDEEDDAPITALDEEF